MNLQSVSGGAHYQMRPKQKSFLTNRDSHAVRRGIASCAMMLVGTITWHLSAIAGPDRLMQFTYDQRLYYVYPQLYDRKPDIPSPVTTADGVELALVCTKAGRYAVFDVTVRNGDSLNYKSGKSGCGFQLIVDLADFPTLAATGLHSDQELSHTATITGKTTAEITRIGRPDMLSEAGFLAEDEDIVSVLAGDNNIVRTLGLTHPQMARPLFHVWNIVHAHEEVSNRKDGTAGSLDYLLYNGRKIYIGAGSGHGWQESIFDDEVLGMFQLEMWRDLTDAETSFLKKEYPELSEDQMLELVRRLAHVHTGEMVPYYIMRYGFYEGHTSYRADPIAIAFVFGLRSIEEIEKTFKGRLHEVLSKHFKPADTPALPLGDSR